MIPDFSIKTVLGQDLNPYVVNNKINHQSNCDNIETVEEEGNAKNEILANNRDRSCPKSRFFDSRSIGQDVIHDPVLDPVLEAKITILDKNKENNSVINNKDFTHLKLDLKTFKSGYDRKRGGVSNIDEFVDNFLKSGHNGYMNLFSNEDIKFEAVKICKAISQQNTSSVVLVEEGMRILKGEGY